MNDLRWLLPVLRPHRAGIIVGAAAVLLQTACVLAAPWIVKWGIDGAILPADHTVLVQVGAASLGVVALRFVAGRIETRVVSAVGQHALTDVRLRLFDHVQRQSVAFHHDEGPGGVVARVVGDVDALTDLLTDGIVRLATNLLTLVGVGTLLLVLDWRLALAVMGVVPALAAASRWFRSRSGPAWREVRRTNFDATRAWQQTVTGATITRDHGAEAGILKSLRAAVRRDADAQKRTVTIASTFFPGVDLVAAGAAIVVVVHGGSRVLAGELEVGTLTAFLLYLRVAFGPVFGLSQLYDSVQAGIAGARRVMEVLIRDPDPSEPCHPQSPTARRGLLHLDGVRFAYPGGPPVLHGIDLVIPAGATVALVGTTGAGKSTIARLVLRLYDPAAGTIRLDGVDLRRMSTTELRTTTAYVPQESHLFSGTVAENIGFGPSPVEPSLVDAAVRAVGAHDQLGGILDQDVAEDGSNLSAGQRQLIALARAWLTDPCVLVLDEATNRLDAEADARVREALRRVRTGRTTIVIAHRLSTALDADLVAVVAGGAIVELGAPAHLLARDSEFARLHRSGG